MARSSASKNAKAVKASKTTRPAAKAKTSARTVAKPRPATTTAALRTATTAPAAGRNPDLAHMRDQQQSESARLCTLIQQAHEAQRALASVQKNLANLEAQEARQQSAEHERLQEERDQAQQTIAALQEQAAGVERAVQQSLKALRALSTSLAAAPDPLLPLAEEDDTQNLDQLRERLKAGDEGQDPLAAMTATLQLGRELVQSLGSRAKVQSNRVKLLQRHVADLEGRNNGLDKERAALQEQLKAATSELDSTRSQLADAQASVARLQDELEDLEARSQAAATAASEQEIRLNERIEEIEGALGAATAQVTAREERIQQLLTTARDADQALLALAEHLLTIAESDGAGNDRLELPPLTLVRDELEAVIGEAGEALDGEVDEVFANDMTEDIQQAARAMSDVLRERRKTTFTAIADLQDRLAKLGGDHEEQAQQLADTLRDLRQVQADLERVSAQHEASVADVDRLSQELTARNKELSQLRTEQAALTSEVDKLGARAEQAKELQAQLKTVLAERDGLSRQADKQARQNALLTAAQKQLGGSLVDLATATDAALSVTNLKSGMQLGRFTKTFQRLDDDSAGADTGVQMVKAAIDVVEKVAARLSQVTQEMQRRGDSLNERNRTISELEKNLQERSKTCTHGEDQIRALTQEHQELTRQLKKAAKTEQTLTEREAALTKANDELTGLRTALKQSRAELEEIKAREASISEGASQEIGDLKRRLTEEQRQRRNTEATTIDQREELESTIATLQARIGELESSIDERDAQLSTLRSELDEAAAQTAHVGELELRLHNISEELAAQQARNRDLEENLEAAEAAGELRDELDHAHAQRDELIAIQHGLERDLADAKADNASLRSLNQNMRQKLDQQVQANREENERLQERLDSAMEENRRMREQLAGLNARVRTLTES